MRIAVSVLIVVACGGSSDPPLPDGRPGGDPEKVTLLRANECFYAYRDIFGSIVEQSTMKVHAADEAGVYATCRSFEPAGDESGASTTRLFRIASASDVTVLTSTPNQIFGVATIDGHVLWTEYHDDREPERTLHLLRAGSTTPEMVTTPAGPNFFMTPNLATAPGSVWFAINKSGHLEGDPPEDRALVRFAIAEGTFEIIPAPYKDAQGRGVSSPALLVPDGDQVFWIRGSLTLDTLEIVATNRTTRQHRLLGEAPEPSNPIPGGFFAFGGAPHYLDEQGCVGRYDPTTGARTQLGACAGRVTDGYREGATFLVSGYPGKKELYGMALDATTGFTKLADYDGCVATGTPDAFYCAGDRTVERWIRRL